MDSLWTEELPDQVYDWLDTVKDKATEIISLTIRLRRKQVACHFIDLDGARRKATFYIDQGTKEL